MGCGKIRRTGGELLRRVYALSASLRAYERLRYPHGFRLFLELLARVIRLDRLRDDSAGRIAFLEVLTLGCNRPRHVTTRQAESNRQARQYRRHDRCHDFVNLVFVHNSSFHF